MSIKHVAVIIVTYKTADLTIECLRSIEAERKLVGSPLITVAIVDTSSEDFPSIQQVIDSSGWSDWVQISIAPKNGGFAYGNNYGVKLASQRTAPHYVHLLNPDTLVRSGAITSLLKFLEDHPDVGIAGSSFENLDGSDWPFAFRFPTIMSEIEEGIQFGLMTRLLNRWVVARTMGTIPERVDWVPGASMMIRSSVYELLGGLDEKFFLYFEETDFCYRAKQKGFETWYVPQSRVMHIAGQSTMVTERKAEVRRLPPYWFESRRRFFLKSYGLYYSILTDIAAVFSRSIGAIKRYLLRQSPSIPNYMTDFLRHSTLRATNRRSIDAT